MQPADGQTILITGATDGIGRIAAQMLAGRGAQVLLHGRNRLKLADAAEELKQTTGNSKIEWFAADLAVLEEVRGLAQAVSAKHPTLSLLINNAGAGSADPRLSPDGHELRFAVNYLAPFLLTRLLLPALKKAAPARIVNVASAGQHPIDFDDVMLEKQFSGFRAYSQSKLALIMFTLDLADELAPAGITVNSLHPGTYLDTNMVRRAGVTPLGSAESGAQAIVHLALSPELEGVSGKYFNVQSEARALAQAYDPEARRRLRELSRRLTGLQP